MILHFLGLVFLKNFETETFYIIFEKKTVMKKLNLIYLKGFKIFLATLGLMLGFSFKVAAQYGVVEEDYIISGAVLSMDCDFKIPNIKISLVDNDKVYNIPDFKKFTDSGGLYYFTLRKEMLDDDIDIVVEDLDSAANMGWFQKKTIKLHVDRALFNQVNKSEWRRSYQYPEQVLIYMESMGIAPCDESKRRKKQ